MVSPPNQVFWTKITLKSNTFLKFKIKLLRNFKKYTNSCQKFSLIIFRQNIFHNRNSSSKIVRIFQSGRILTKFRKEYTKLGKYSLNPMKDFTKFRKKSLNFIKDSTKFRNHYLNFRNDSLKNFEKFRKDFIKFFLNLVESFLNFVDSSRNPFFKFKESILKFKKSFLNFVKFFGGKVLFGFFYFGFWVGRLLSSWGRDGFFNPQQHL